MKTVRAKTSILLLIAFCIFLCLSLKTNAFGYKASADILEKHTVKDMQGNYVNKATIFIGDVDEASTHTVKTSSSYMSDTYGDNYYANYNQEKEIKDQIDILPKNKILNVVGYGAGGATAAKIAVAYPQRINILLTLDPSGEHPDFSIVKKSVGQWINVNAEGH